MYFVRVRLLRNMNYRSLYASATRQLDSVKFLGFGCATDETDSELWLAASMTYEAVYRPPPEKNLPHWRASIIRAKTGSVGEFQRRWNPWEKKNGHEL